MARAEEFLAAIREIEEVLKVRSGKDANEALRVAVERSKLLTYPDKKFLKDIAIPLRNHIVHEAGGEPEFIADPRQSVVDRLNQIARNLTKPPLVYEVLRGQEPTIVDSADDIEAFLVLVRDNDYSQAPVEHSGGPYGLITTNAIARWVASEYVRADGAAVSSASVAQVLGNGEASDLPRFLSRQATTVEAIRLLSAAEGALPPAALLVTENGRSSEKPLVIATQADLPKLYEALGMGA